MACASVGVAVGYVLLLLLSGTEQAAFSICDFAGLPEPTSVRARTSFWPPGKHCLYRLPDGTTVERTGGFGGAEAIFVGLAAVVGGTCPYAARKVIRYFG